jgi:ABC-type Zn uptake system ZnuABC Zn-binding protein ZnuA
MSRWRVVCCLFALSFVGSARSANDASDVLVLTALPATYSIASALSQGTHVRVVNVPPEGRPMSALGRYLEKPNADVLKQLQAADAVVTIGKLWREDPLFPAARAQNIRVVDIDATQPWSSTMAGIALVRQPEGRAPWQKEAAAAASAERPASTYFWLSPSNGARAAEIIAHDLARLSASDAERIAQNLAAFRRKLFGLQQTYEAKLSALENVTVFALTADFAHLTADLGIFVDGYFVRQDLEWTPADIDAFRKHLRDRGVRVVIHKWQPSEAIAKAVTEAGASLVVLRPGEQFASRTTARAESYIADLEANLNDLYQALSVTGR